VSRLRIWLAAFVAIAAIALSACGDDNSSSSSSTTASVDSTSEQTDTAAGSTTSTSSDASNDPAIAGTDFDPAAVYDAAAPGVVTIRSIFAASGESSILGGGGAQAGQGSGFVISDKGEILTNAHVVTNGEAGGSAASLKPAKEVYVQFPDQNQVQAEIVGYDPYADVALIKVDPDGLDLHPLQLGDDGDLRVGDPVATLGSPFGEEQSLSVGVVSATDRTIQSLTEFGIDGAIQTDASINPGNSGGPMLDSQARVLGLNQQIESTSGGNQGVGFAVPIDLAKRSLEQLRDKGSVDYAYIGVTTQALYPQLADKLGVDADTGALVVSVVNGGPADDAGLRGGDSQIRFQGQQVDVGGDVITALNGQPVVGASDLPRLVSRLDPGDEVTVTVLRDGEKQDIKVKLEERPTNVKQ
jgi:S1-C subfamily serine protease